MIWKKSMQTVLCIPKISKKESNHSGRKKAFQSERKTFLDSQGLISFQISSAWQHTLCHCSSPYLSFESVLLSNFNPPICRRMAKWLPPPWVWCHCCPLETEQNFQNVAEMESAINHDCECCWNVGAYRLSFHSSPSQSLGYWIFLKISVWTHGTLIMCRHYMNQPFVRTLTWCCFKSLAAITAQQTMTFRDRPQKVTFWTAFEELLPEGYFSRIFRGPPGNIPWRFPKGSTKITFRGLPL